MKSIRDLPLMEQLAIEQALFSRIGNDVSTENPESLRSYADSQLIGSYYTTGARSYDQFVNGQKVGTYTVRVGRGTKEQKKTHLVVSKPDKLESYVNSPECSDEVAEYMVLMAQNFASWMLETYGIVCDGCEVWEETISAESPKVLGTTLRIDAEKVSEALAGYLPTTIAGLLGEGSQ